MIKLLPLSAATLIAASASLYLPSSYAEANNERAHSEQRGGKHHRGGHGKMRHLKKQLDLSEEQKQQLKQQRQSNKQQMHTLHQQMRDFKHQLRELSQDYDANQSQIRALADDIGDLTAEITVQKAQQKSFFYSILDAEQKQRLDQIRQDKKQRRKQHKDFMEKRQSTEG